MEWDARREKDLLRGRDRELGGNGSHHIVSILNSLHKVANLKLYEFLLNQSLKTDSTYKRSRKKQV